MNNLELPKWPGADVVYSRLYWINYTLCSQAWEAANGKRKQYTIPSDVLENIEAMNAGDEEACKAAVARHLHIALSKAA